jgi:hypothetical protein
MIGIIIKFDVSKLECVLWQLIDMLMPVQVVQLHANLGSKVLPC